MAVIKTIGAVLWLILWACILLMLNNKVGNAGAIAGMILFVLNAILFFTIGGEKNDRR